MTLEELTVDSVGEFLDGTRFIVQVKESDPWVKIRFVDGDPKVMEPTKCLEWRWVTPSEFVGLTPQEGEQIHWAPHRVMRIILPRIGFHRF